MRKRLRVQDSRRAIELLNDADIISETSFLLGFPDDTPQTVEETLGLSFEYAPDLAFFLAITPWPYADWYADVADRVEVHDYSKYNLINPILRPDAMTRDELAALLSGAFMRFYGHKMRDLAQMTPHKRTYMTRVAKLLMENSYLAAEVMASMPHSGRPAGVAA
jgi:anaerobic magnesium-protoporphyrin IX monomethyl ester cyclase